MQKVFVCTYCNSIHKHKYEIEYLRGWVGFAHHIYLRVVSQNGGQIPALLPPLREVQGHNCPPKWCTLANAMEGKSPGYFVF